MPQTLCPNKLNLNLQSLHTSRTQTLLTLICKPENDLIQISCDLPARKATQAMPGRR